MKETTLKATKAFLFLLLGIAVILGHSSCSHGSSGDFDDDSETRYFGISGGTDPETKPAPIPATAPAPTVAPAPAPAPQPVKRYKPVIKIIQDGFSDIYPVSNLTCIYASGTYYTKANGDIESVPTTMPSSRKTWSDSFSVQIWALDEDTNQARNVTSSCSFTCNWTLTPNPSYDAQYAVIDTVNSPACTFTVTLPPGLQKQEERIQVVNSTQTGTIGEKDSDLYHYDNCTMGVDIEFTSSTIDFTGTFPKNYSKNWSIVCDFRYEKGEYPYSSGGSNP